MLNETFSVIFKHRDGVANAISVPLILPVWHYFLLWPFLKNQAFRDRWCRSSANVIKTGKGH